MKQTPFRLLNVLFILVLIPVFTIRMFGQDLNQILTLENAINIATENSLAAFKAKNMYLARQWEYRSYQASHLPNLSLSTTPADFNRALTRRYDSEQDIDVYRAQQNVYSSLNMSLNQNLFWTGGYLFLDSDIGRIQNFGEAEFTEFSNTPIRVGVVQPLFAYNQFKWQSKLAPLKFEKAKKEYISNEEEIKLQVCTYFFNLIDALEKLNNAKSNKFNADTLYMIGQQRLELASLTRDEVLTLRLNKINAANNYEDAQFQFERAKAKLLSYLGQSENNEIQLVIPENLPDVTINPEMAVQKAFTNSPEILEMREMEIMAEQQVAKTKADSRFNANMQLSFGLNQHAENLSETYQNLLDQQKLQLMFQVPIIDWGVSKGKYNMAKLEREATLNEIQQNEIDFRQDIRLTSIEFDLQKNRVLSAAEADTVASLAYETAKKRFLIGQGDVIKLHTLQNAKDQARNNYIDAIRKYWDYYYRLRKMTLFDFEENIDLTIKLEEKLNH